MLRPIRVFTMSACAILYIIQMAVAEEEIVSLPKLALN